MEKTSKQSELKNLKVDLKIHKGKTKYTTNNADSEDILLDQETKWKKVTKFKYLAQTTQLQEKKSKPGSEQYRVALGEPPLPPPSFLLPPSHPPRKCFKIDSSLYIKKTHTHTHKQQQQQK